MANKKTKFRLSPKHSFGEKPRRSASVFMLDTNKHPNFKPYLNVVVSGDNIEDMLFSVATRDMEAGSGQF